MRRATKDVDGGEVGFAKTCMYIFTLRPVEPEGRNWRARL